MKLLSKINRQFILLSIPVLILLTIPIYFIVLTIQENEITEGLRATESWVSNSILAKKSIPDLYPIIEVKNGNELKETVVKDTLILDPIENDYELFRELISVKSISCQIRFRQEISDRSIAKEEEDEEKEDGK